MKERPDIDDKTILENLNYFYPEKFTSIDFLPFGNNANSFVYQVSTKKIQYFLKLRRGNFSPGGVLLQDYLSNHSSIVTPSVMRNSIGNLWSEFGQFTFIVSEYASGLSGDKAIKDEGLFQNIGSIARELHRQNPPAEIISHMPIETFDSNRKSDFLAIRNWVRRTKPKTDFKAHFQNLWNKYSNEVELVLSTLLEMESNLRTQEVIFCVCHSDLHLPNFLVDKNNTVAVIDWDNPILAPVERDLVYIIGKEGEKEFLRGYGKYEHHHQLLKYYRFERALEAIVEYGKRIIFYDYLGRLTKESDLISFEKLFMDNGPIHFAKSPYVI